MRALRYEGPASGVVLSRTAPAPEPGEGEALIRPLRTAVSRFDARCWRGRPAVAPVTLGHEFVGVVERIGAGPGRRGDPLVGARVVGSINAVCGSCDLCRSGLSNHCRSRTVLGVHGRDGCFADLFTLPLRNLHRVPGSVDDDRAVFAEPLAAAIQAAQQMRIEGKPYITVLGDGPVGLLCAQLMQRLNASVRVVGRHQNKLDLCEKWGIRHRHEKETGRRADQDIVVDCTGEPDGLALAMRLVRPRGKILLKGSVHPAPGEEPSQIDLRPIATGEIEVVGSRCGPIGEALGLLEREEVDVVSLISRRARLDDGVEALRAAADPASLRVLIEP